MKKQGTNNVRVQCVETGEEWGSIRECALALGCSAANVSMHIRFAEPINGLNYIKRKTTQ